MTEILLIAAIVLLLAVLGLQLILLFRKSPIDFSPIQQANERTERAVRDEFSRNRTESATLAIQQRSSEVWKLLAAVKTEFGKYGDILDKVQRKLQEATNTLDTAAVRTRTIERKLRDVQERPASDAQSVLMLESVEENGDIAAPRNATVGGRVMNPSATSALTEETR